MAQLGIRISGRGLDFCTEAPRRDLCLQSVSLRGPSRLQQTRICCALVVLSFYDLASFIVSLVFSADRTNRALPVVDHITLSACHGLHSPSLTGQYVSAAEKNSSKLFMPMPGRRERLFAQLAGDHQQRKARVATGCRGDSKSTFFPVSMSGAHACPQKP
jgi:hypothetical protein